MPDNLSEIQKAIIILLDERQNQNEKYEQLRHNHLELYSIITSQESKLNTMESANDKILREMRDQRLQNDKLYKNFFATIVKQNEKITKQQAQLDRHQDQLDRHQDQLDRKLSVVEENQVSIRLTMEMLKLAVDDLLALRRDYNKLHDTVNTNDLNVDY
jgi:chromosome segregation ATPase